MIVNRIKIRYDYGKIEHAYRDSFRPHKERNVNA